MSAPLTHRETTPDLASPRFRAAGAPDGRLPPPSRIEIIAGLALSAWGLVLIAVAIIRSL